MFGLFRKMYSFVLSGNEISYDPLAFCKNSICAKNLILKLWPKILSPNQVSVFFNHQYLVNRLTFHFDFLHVDRHEWTRQGLLVGFLKKYLSGQMSHFEPKMAHLITLDPLQGFFWNFAQWKGPRGIWKLY